MLASRHSLTSLLLGCVAACAVRASETNANPPDAGIVVIQAPDQALSPEHDTACELARKLARAAIFFSDADGQILDRSGARVALKDFRVIWCHQGESIPRAGPGRDAIAKALRQFVEGGGGLLLSGEAASLIDTMGIDTVRVRAGGHDREQAGLVPVATTHPAFDRADIDRGVLWMSNAVFPAFAEFHPAGNPPRGMLLARTPGGPEIPLVEYQVGRGRVIAMAWRLGRQYGEAAVMHRANFERLAANLLRYLGDSRQWRPLTSGASESPIASQRSADAQLRALELAIQDLIQTFGGRYPRGPEYLNRLKLLRKSRTGTAQSLAQLRNEALLANPLLDFSKLLLIQRGDKQLGLPMNYLSNSSLPPTGYDNQIAVLSPVHPGGKLTTLFKPAGGRFVGDIDLHWDAGRMLFSMPDASGRWRVHEIGVDGANLREVPLIRESDVDNYDACYLPDGGTAFCSTACFTGVPCINGSGHVCNLYRAGPDGRVRQLTVEQDHDWCPTVLNSGGLMYLRWEYTDIPHAFSRILFSMNPDGAGQMALYGNGSYWPASMFYARPIPGHATKIVAIVGGHHELPRMGDLVIFDPDRSRFESDGVVQRVPGRGRPVAPALLDLPISQSWPKFLHPWPLSEKYFLVSCKPTPDSPWGIYLVDVFDNSVLLCQQSGYALFEPIPLRKTLRPPVMPEKVDHARRDAEVLVADVYHGEGLRGVPRGTIKSLRVIGYQFGYQGMGAEPYSVGLDGPWDPKRVLGTVPVYEDGSARFRVPAYTPISLQPLDADGQAVQLMRSWLTAMPGEVVSCSGCHENQNTAAPVRPPIAVRRPRVEIQPWYGPARGFDFRREVQPVLDRYCVACHDGVAAAPDLRDGKPLPTLENNHAYNLASRFSPSYYQLRRFVRTPTKESDLHMLMPWEFHADTARLVQLLRKGHHNVKLDSEAWDRLITWIDLNAPFHGTWTDIRGQEIAPQLKRQWERRREMRRLYAGIDDDYEAIAAPVTLGPPIRSAPLPSRAWPQVDVPGWPFDAAEAARRQRAAGRGTLSVPLSEGISLELAPIPAGEFVMGQGDGFADEQPRRVKIARSFLMGRFEVTNEQFALFDPAHDSRFEPGDYIQFSPGERGWPVSRPRQPVVRISWHQAVAFCRWLSGRTGRTFTLPTETQWEYACRAGTNTSMWYGNCDADFSKFANLSDVTHQSIDVFGWADRARAIPPWRPADARFNDHSRVSAPAGSYRPNPWGLFDMHGNAAEWTLSERSPVRDSEKRPAGSYRVVRGGSWYDRPDRCRSAFRQVYLADQPVFDVGFRVICE